MAKRRYTLIVICLLAGLSLMVSTFAFAADAELEAKQKELKEIEQLIDKYEKLFKERRKSNPTANKGPGKEYKCA